MQNRANESHKAREQHILYLLLYYREKLTINGKMILDKSTSLISRPIAKAIKAQETT